MMIYLSFIIKIKWINMVGDGCMWFAGRATSGACGCVVASIRVIVSYKSLRLSPHTLPKAVEKSNGLNVPEKVEVHVCLTPCCRHLLVLNNAPYHLACLHHLILVKLRSYVFAATDPRKVRSCFARIFRSLSCHTFTLWALVPTAFAFA